TVKTYRFGRWQCIGYNQKTDCGGDMIWDSDAMECIPDESRKPLCAQQQTAVLVDDVWECINPFPEHNCPTGMISRLNYSTLVWECVEDPSVTQTVSKCSHVTKVAIAGALGATLRVPTSSCTDCEKMITDPDTCETACIPNPDAINNPQCYDAPTRTCSGSSRAFYFGFPNASYARNVDAVAGYSIPLDRSHSQNRKFNCLDCGDGIIDTERSKPPYIAICK
ncbi:hypothetical protein HDR66_02975, partial [bacterium]|nr:hypothetical protein [bacterium]